MTAKSDPNAFQEELRRLGYRLTPQRESILQVFQALPEGTHLSVEELHQALAREGGHHGISLATTYRTVKLLASLGLLRELDFAEGHKHYESSTPQAAPHHHLICVGCSATIEFEGAELLYRGVEVARTHGYRMIDVQYKVFGVCPACEARGSRK